MSTPTAPTEPTVAEEAAAEKFHLSLLKSGYIEQDIQQLTSTPIFTHGALKKHPESFSQYGFLAGDTKTIESHVEGVAQSDPRLYFNISAPSSVFICGSQGSGKSHTLSCLLENCLVKSGVSKLDNPLAGLVFHYDTFTSDIEGIPCEAAYLSSNPGIKVRVLCSPANIETIKRTYKSLKNVQIESLKIDQKDLDTKRMLDLMAVSTDNGPMPLYLHSINRILRELRIEQQAMGVNAHFNYSKFKQKVSQEAHTAALHGVRDENGQSDMNVVFDEIANLRVGEALLFAPSATVNTNGGIGTKRLGTDYLRIRVRSRITFDGGKSRMA